MASYKDFNREIKGYVEVLYNVDDYTNADLSIGVSGVSTQPLPYSQNAIELFENPRVIDNYAILYNNYTKLDGSFFLFNEVQNQSGFITMDTPAYYDARYDKNIKIIIYNNNLSKVTVYMAKNRIINCVCRLYSGMYDVDPIETININNNLNDYISLDFEGTGKRIEIEVTNWENWEWRPVVSHVDIGLTSVYKDNDLIQFKVVEEVNKLVEKTPNNLFTLQVGDYEDKFNPQNPKGWQKYLNDNVKFIPYIGLTDNNGVSYTKVGNFYYDTIDYRDKEITFNAYNKMKKLSEQLLTNNNGNVGSNAFQIPLNGLKNYLENYLQYNYDGEYEVNIQNKIRMYTMDLKRKTIVNFLQDATMIDGIFYIDRNDKIIIKSVDKTITDTLSKNELLENVKYVKEDKITSFNLKSNNYSIGSTSQTNDTNNFSYTFTLSKSPEIICITSDDMNTALRYMRNDYLSVTGASSYDILKGSGASTNDFKFMLFVKVYGTVGNEISISGRYPNKIEYSQSESTKIIGNGEPKLIIENPFYSMPFYVYDGNNFTNFFDKAYSYSVKFNYNGSPLIKAGSYINVETDYGILPIFIQKHELTFNGGLTGYIEGVE